MGLQARPLLQLLQAHLKVRTDIKIFHISI
jgi:hypothetical protein